jgi:FixJ family two-component response regulator
MFEGLRKPTTLIVIVLTLLASGCPTQAIVQAFGLDERTVARWRDRAGKQWKPRASGSRATGATGSGACTSR